MKPPLPPSRPPPPVRSPRRAQETTAALRLEITSGRFGEAIVLPGERQLADLLHVSRTTLRRAMAELIDEGLLSQRQGLGTVVNRAVDRKEPQVHQIEPKRTEGSFEPVVETLEMARGFADPTADEAMMLACPPGRPVFRISRLMVRDECPLAIEHAAAPIDLLAGPVPEPTSLPAALAAQGHAAIRTLKRLRSVPASRTEAEALHIAPDTMAILLLDVAILADGRACALTRSLFRLDRFDIVLDGLAPPIPRLT